MGLPNPSRETISSDANGNTEIFIFPVQLTASTFGNFTRLILTLAICDDHRYIIHNNTSMFSYRHKKAAGDTRIEYSDY